MVPDNNGSRESPVNGACDDACDDDGPCSFDGTCNDNGYSDSYDSADSSKYQTPSTANPSSSCLLLCHASPLHTDKALTQLERFNSGHIPDKLVNRKYIRDIHFDIPRTNDS